MLKLLIVLLVYVTASDARTIKNLADGGRSVWFNETIPSSSFGASGFGGTWISGNEFTYSSNRNMIKHNIITRVNETLLDSTFSARWSGASLTLSPGRTKVLVRYAQRSIFRHSTVAKFSVVFMDNLEVEYKISDGDEIQLCKFSPNDDGLIYIKQNTIYHATDEQIKAGRYSVQSPPGEDGVLYFGIPDWVYEEEVLGSDAAAWFSKDGKYLAYAFFDDTNVKDFMYELYGDGKNEYQYPKEVHLRYPKVGEANPRVSLLVNDLTDSFGTPFSLNYPEKVTTDHILGTVFWITDTKLGAIWLNRRQNYGVFVSYLTDDNWRMEEIMEINEPNGWIELNTPKCETTGICYFINNADNWPSLTRVDTNQKTSNVLTKDKHVLSYYGSRNGKLYYLSTPGLLKSFDRHLYVYENDEEKCLTCELKTPEGNTCTYVSASFSTDLSYYSLSCSGPDPSFTKIYQTDDPNAEAITWQENTALRTKLRDYALPRTEIFHVPVGEFKAAVKMLIPPEIDFDNQDSVKEMYPMLVRVYGGPGSVRVASSFSIGYQTYQVTTKKIIYVEIDGRGTGQKGVDMMFSINDRLGTYEMEDQISVTKHLIATYKFIDPKRVSIWGWSYGGYATAMTLAKDTENVFKCGVSVAPVTSWIFYDTIYTERYMGINPYSKQYNESDVSNANHIEIIGKHDFLLVHGNADDNVHYQQSMVLAGALEKADIMFDQMSYPDEAHSLSGVSLHLYHTLDRFWDKCFNL
ncbi:hypothetical protein PVAND_005017 [Polypedilum vanderplanki]|uniref:Venom dipeptidyl peptidase 4 n=1 Tax=Polypedilum vanderplanki TaxID=319348 RepID=A0A9J6BZS9_POLVA|nr:hypothetical protein PVAND_005017 [Polypedilum vanderplanki]